MVYGNFLSLFLYCTLLLLCAIFTNSGVLYLFSAVNFIWLFYQQSKKKNKVSVKSKEEIEVENDMNFVISLAKENIENKYGNTPISDEEKNNMVWIEVAKILEERKK